MTTAPRFSHCDDTRKLFVASQRLPKSNGLCDDDYSSTAEEDGSFPIGNGRQSAPILGPSTPQQDQKQIHVPPNGDDTSAVAPRQRKGQESEVAEARVLAYTIGRPL